MVRQRAGAEVCQLFHQLSGAKEELGFIVQQNVTLCDTLLDLL